MVQLLFLQIIFLTTIFPTYRLGELDVDTLTNYVKSIGRVEEVKTGRIIVIT